MLMVDMAHIAGLVAASGIRLGTPAVTTRGMCERGRDEGDWSSDRGRSPAGVPAERVRAQVKELCAAFPIYPGFPA